MNYKVKHYLRLFYCLIPIKSTCVMNIHELSLYLNKKYKTNWTEKTSLKFLNSLVIINGWKCPNIGIRMRVVKC